ncbi:uncharacterized protein LOC127863512 [Dreissena polymorpha]|uniref:Mab-21-like HhH/H2TH-like domain-containing protein n=1 Tax=Dreissena polymorpha TaxID=45954 RepID=A0A9D4B7D1_DREPO|nr:uncharacterized protein LOC127863512 [Dreissena polymorpha]KAH3691965.1 hypothetical protein DPMN_191380 [Dreissena polymorpha]
MADGAGKPHVPGTDRTTGCNISSSSPSRLNNEDASVELSNVLNILGYGSELRQKRREYFKQLGDAVKVIIVGSKAEGILRVFESDIDSLYVNERVACLEVGYDVNLIPENKLVFRMDTSICYPGHCILLLERGFPSLFVSALCYNGHGRFLLSSDAFINLRRKYLPPLMRDERAGPSLPISFGPISCDCVVSLRCHCPSILQKWAARSRHWPPPNIVGKVVSMGAVLTPVGFKESENMPNEWRVCFNTGETELVINLNDTQIKVYVLLKMIAKDVLKPRQKGITSFMVKNIILWLAENNPQSTFHDRRLIFWLLESLKELRTALSTKYLPYYMIPERNLMTACRLTVTLQRKWMATLTDMIVEGPEMLRRLPKIRQAIIAHPEPLLWYTRRRIEMEIIFLEMLTHCDPVNNNNFFNMFDFMDRHGLTLRLMEICGDFIANMCSEENIDILNIVQLFNFFYRVLA